MTNSAKNPDALLESGFVKDVRSQYVTFQNTDTLYQKKVCDDKGVRFFLNAWYHKEKQIAQHTIPASFSFELQFSQDEGETVININILTDNHEVAEAKANEIWQKLNCDYTKKYGE
tara:strand:+ start:477 stop:824 length:348 start_codon:yes stop_codon:yes gene_type:complete